MEGSSLIMAFIRRHWCTYLAVVGVIAVAEAVQVQIPNVIGNLTNQLHHGGTPDLVFHFGVLVSELAIVYVALFGVGQWLMGRNARILEYDLRQRLFAQWERLSTEYFHAHTVGDLISHALNDVQVIRAAMSGGANELVQASFLFTATLYMTITHVSPALTVITLLPLLALPVIVVVVGSRVRFRSRQVQEALSKMADFAEESLEAIRVVKAVGNETVEVQRFTSRVNDVVEKSLKQVRLNTLFQSLLPFVTGLSFVIALMYGGWLTIYHHIDLGAFVAFTIYLRMLARPLILFGAVINDIHVASASITRVSMLLAVRPTIVDPPTPEQADGSGSVCITGLTFVYPGQKTPMLTNVNIFVPGGSTLGIVGRSGSGKTTLLKLLVREYNPPAGTVYVEGIDVCKMAVGDLRTLITYVPQDGFLFSTTITDNVAFADDQPHAATVDRALREARLDRVVDSLPHRAATEIGERGVTLSGGQRQRLAIARAVYKTEARVLVLDDSLSAVDARTEADILKNLQHQRRTVIITAHRLSAVRHADKILVLEQGRLIECGTHEELLKQRGFYARLYHLQTDGTVKP